MDQLAKQTGSSPPLKGTIVACPDRLPADSAEPLVLRWESNGKAAKVTVSEEGGPEQLFARALTDEATIDWIQAGKTYLFRLYDESQGEESLLLDQVSVFREVIGKLSIECDADDLWGEKPTVIRWEVNSPGSGEVCLSQEGGEERVICQGPIGSYDELPLEPGTHYLLRLYAATAARPLLDEAVYFRKPYGTISVDPNPVPLEAGSTATARWRITSPAIAEVRISEDGESERVVCCGSSGSFPITGLRLGINYRVRLYSQSTEPQLLDETQLRLADVPWESLLQRLTGAESREDLERGAELIARIVPPLLHKEDLQRWFFLWEKSGFHITPVHFYEPVPDSRTLPETLWEGANPLPGVDMQPEMQRQLLCDIFPRFHDDYNAILLERSEDPAQFYINNGRFEGLDAMLSYCLVRHFQPHQIIEVGSGYSTLILAQAARANGFTELHSIEPYPEDFLTRGIPGLTSLLPKKVEEVETSFFDRLSASDCLFIDTSHVVKTGGDVNYLFLQVLPRLQPGVLVHVHDIFLPREYPQEWLFERRRFWTEQYLLQAFLVFNQEFEVLISSAYLKEYFLPQLQAVFPKAAPWQGGSFWMRRRMPAAS